MPWDFGHPHVRARLISSRTIELDFSQMGYFLQGGVRNAINTSNPVMRSFQGHDTLVTAPLVINQYIVIGSSAGNLYALYASNGTVAWQKNLGAPLPGGPPYAESTPLSGQEYSTPLLVLSGAEYSGSVAVASNQERSKARVRPWHHPEDSRGPAVPGTDPVEVLARISGRLWTSLNVFGWRAV